MLMDQKINILFPSFIVLVSFLTLYVLTLVFSTFVNVYAALFILLYSLLGPLLTVFRHKKMYFVLLPIPYLGSWLVSAIFFTSLNVLPLLSMYLISAIPALLATFMHFSSRMRNTLFNRIPMSSLARIGFAETSLIFLVMGLSLLGLETVKLEFYNKATLYGLLIVMYCSSSLIYVNSAYRYRLICKILNTNNIEDKIATLWGKLERKFFQKKEDVELLRYYFSEATRLFEEGSFEMAYFSAYKIIREPTVVDPKAYISDKREGEPSSFSEIRAILMHSRRKDIRVSPKRITETKAKLPQYILEIILRASTFIEELVAKENNS